MDKYEVEMSTGASLLSRWWTIDFAKLAGTLYCSQAVFVPTECTPHVPAPGGWWKCTGHCLTKKQGTTAVLFDWVWLPEQDDNCFTFTEEQLTTLILAAPITSYTI
eukprot:680974-Rhodomonas_salina.9